MTHKKVALYFSQKEKSLAIECLEKMIGMLTKMRCSLWKTPLIYSNHCLIPALPKKTAQLKRKIDVFLVLKYSDSIERFCLL